MSTLLLTGIGRLCTLDGQNSAIEGAQLLIRRGRIVWIGTPGDTAPIETDEVVEVLPCGGRVVLPGFVDCHTHLVFGGDRAHEFGLRASGVPYEDIARQGGGIRSTVADTRAADESTLLELGRKRLDAMLARGVTCVEIKSGYGLELETELKMLRVARALDASHPIAIKTTFLGAHTVPAEFAGRTDAYLDHVVDDMLPRVADEGLADFCDVFCETVAFDVAQSRRVLEAGQAWGLIPKVHAEQLHHTGGTALGVELGAASVDHLEHITDADIEALAGSRTTAVLLPGATLYLGLNDWAPARRLLDAGVSVALATDMNPGSCMCDDLPLMTTLACTRLGMSPQEALRGITIEAARALRCDTERGSLEVGKFGDCVVLEATHEVQLPYRFGAVRPFAVVAAGRVVVGPGRGSLTKARSVL